MNKDKIENLSNISADELVNSINIFKSVKSILEKFNSKKGAVDYLMQKTNLPKKECEQAYDLIIKLNV